MVGTEETALSNDVLKHSLAYRGYSGGLFSEAMRSVSAIGSKDIYPAKFATGRRGDFGGITAIHQEYLAPISQAEAVASQVLVNEAIAMNQAFGKGLTARNKLEEVLGIGREDYPTDVLIGFNEFGEGIDMAATARVIVYHQEHAREVEVRGKVKQTQFDRNNALLADRFSTALHQDNMQIAKASSGAIEGYIREVMDNIVSRNPSDCPKAIRVKNIQKGAGLAKNLYLESLDLAIKNGFAPILTRTT